MSNVMARDTPGFEVGRLQTLPAAHDARATVPRFLGYRAAEDAARDDARTRGDRVGTAVVLLLGWGLLAAVVVALLGSLALWVLMIVAAFGNS